MAMCYFFESYVETEEKSHRYVFASSPVSITRVKLPVVCLSKFISLLEINNNKL